jgi:hypothetical protein
MIALAGAIIFGGFLCLMAALYALARHHRNAEKVVPQ